MKIIISIDGPLSLSGKAFKRYAELTGKECFFFQLSMNRAMDFFWERSDENERMSYAFDKDVFEILKKEGESKLTKDEEKILKAEFKNHSLNHEKIRIDPAMIQVVEEMGELEKNVKVIEIPDDVDWEIEMSGDDYFSHETVREVSRIWQ